MKIDDYPPQEPLSEFGERYQKTCFSLSEGIDGIELQLGRNPYQSLTVYPSPNPSGVVLGWMFGGGWTNGYKEMMGFMAPPLIAAGVTLIAISYRLAPAYTFPANVMDIVSALQWTSDNVGEFGGHREKFFIGGHSAGGHLSALLGTRGEFLTDNGLPKRFIKGALPLSATYDFSAGSGLSMRPRFLGQAGINNEIAASPLFHVDRESAPFMIAWGENDFAHLRQQALKFVELLRYRGVPCQALEMERCDHLETAYEAANTKGQWFNAALNFMNAIVA
ncbi:alpha/beta hydrolase [Paraburkholderia sediminicola]|uniref:alpha/beta hydrolase n=1 Tax=Paraburkholderia sediminicola TaxID=458836 RepID=UPI0038BC126C